MQVINLFGEPCAGKSTVAAGVFYYMKKAGYNVELVTEYAKDLVYSESKLINNQVAVSAEQFRRLDVLRDKVDYVITDSPLMTGVLYCPEMYKKDFSVLIHKLHNSFNNINYHLLRSHKYVGDGRLQDEREAGIIGVQVHNLLHDFRMPCVRVTSDIAVHCITQNMLISED